MSSNDVRKMMDMSHVINEVRSALDQPGDQQEQITEKIDQVLARGTDPITLANWIAQWMGVNNITTESKVFDQNGKFAIEYLETKVQD